MPRMFWRPALAMVLWLSGAALATAQTPTAPIPTQPNASPAPGPKVLTGKERLGEKWTDEQRIDNCKVPVDKRGSKPRPDACAKPSS
ncbi:MAG: hypothetical protein JO128_09870 [Alphaproteobacteria bacterium]|nr:hypothetical protein [Alphaproteobacteria bacterium]